MAGLAAPDNRAVVTVAALLPEAATEVSTEAAPSPSASVDMVMGDCAEELRLTSGPRLEGAAMSVNVVSACPS